MEDEQFEEDPCCWCVLDEVEEDELQLCLLTLLHNCVNSGDGGASTKGVFGDDNGEDIQASPPLFPLAGDRTSIIGIPLALQTGTLFAPLVPPQLLLLFCAGVEVGITPGGGAQD